MKKLVALGVAWGTLGLAPAVSAAPLSLEEAVGLALQNNLGLEQAHRDVRVANADVMGARSVFLPQIAWSGAYTRSEFPFADFVRASPVLTNQTLRSSTTIGLTLFDGLGNVRQYQQASRARTAADERYEGTAQGVVYETARRFFEIRKQEALLEVQQEASKLSEEQLKKTDAMKELGAATQADVYKAEVDHANNRLAALRTERDLAVARASLNTYLGLDAQAEVTLAEEDLDVTREYDLETAIEKAQELNPSLRAARATESSRDAGVRTQKAARYPSVSISANHRYDDIELNPIEPDVNSSWNYVVSAQFTLFDGLLTKSRIRQAEANLVESRRAVESTQRDVLFGVRQAHLDLEIARESIAVAEEAVRSSEEDLRLARERYKIGEGTILDVIDAQVNLTRSRTNLVTANYDARLAVLALRRAIGDIPVPEVE